MAVRKRTEAQRAADLVQIEYLHLRGKTQLEIADAISKQRPYTLSRQQVDYDLRSLTVIWKAEANKDKADAIARELAEIKSLQKEYYDAWQRTLDERTKTRTEQSSITGEPDKKGKQKGSAKAVIEKETMLGNPAYLAGVMSCIERRCKMLGLDAPVKNETTLKNVDLTKLTDSQLSRIATGEDVLQVILSDYVATA